jgi:hypothetical protein
MASVTLRTSSDERSVDVARGSGAGKVFAWVVSLTIFCLSVSPSLTNVGSSQKPVSRTSFARRPSTELVVALVGRTS